MRYLQIALPFVALFQLSAMGHADARAQAQTTAYVIPDEKTLRGKEAVMLKNLETPTLVKGNGFSFKIPKGWTLRVGEGTDKLFMVASAYPVAAPTDETASFDLAVQRNALDFDAIKKAQMAQGNKILDITVTGHKGLRFDKLQLGEDLTGRSTFGIAIKAKRDLVATGIVTSSDKENIAKLKEIISSLTVQ